MQRIPFPPDVCADPDARYYSTLAEAPFLCNAHDAVAIHCPQRGPARWPWVIAGLLLLGSAVLLAGCSAQAADAPGREDPRNAAAQRACPPGHVVDWIGPNEMQCLRHVE